MPAHARACRFSIERCCSERGRGPAMRGANRLQQVLCLAARVRVARRLACLPVARPPWRRTWLARAILLLVHAAVVGVVLPHVGAHHVQQLVLGAPAVGAPLGRAVVGRRVELSAAKEGTGRTQARGKRCSELQRKGAGPTAKAARGWHPRPGSPLSLGLLTCWTAAWRRRPGGTGSWG